MTTQTQIEQRRAKATQAFVLRAFVAWHQIRQLPVCVYGACSHSAQPKAGNPKP